jgi:hypothetical protein
VVHNYTDKNNIDRHFGYGSDSTNGHHKVTEPDKPGITLEQYAAAKKLPIEFLQSINLKNTNYDFSPAVRIPYPDELGREVYHRYRVALKGEPRFKAPAKATGAKPIPYGLQVLANARESGYILLVEGESDAQVCWYNDIPALGIPGVQAWKRWGKEWAEHLHNIPIILVPVEADGGGEQFWNLVRTTSSLIGRVGQLPITNRHLKDIGKVWESAVDGGDSSKFKTTVENMVWLTSLTFTPLGNVDVNDVRNPSFFGAVRLVDVEDPGPDNYLVRDMVMDREPTYFYAAEGTCKSLMTTALGVAIASPEVSSIFGHQVETHGPVVLFDAELTVHRFRKRVAEICRGHGVQFPTNIYYKNVVRVSPKISFPELHGLVENVGAIAVVIDSIGFATRGDPESYNDVRNQTTEYIDPLIKQGVAPIVVDHKPHSGDHMIGSVAKGYHGRIIFRVDDKDGDDRTPGERHICLVNKKASFADEGHKVGLTLRFRPGEIQFEYDQTVGVESERRSKPTVEARVLEALTEGDKTKLAIHQHTNTLVTTLSNTLPGMVRSNTIRVVGAEGREYVYGINTTEDKEGLRTSLTSTFPRGVNVNDVDETPLLQTQKTCKRLGYRVLL